MDHLAWIESANTLAQRYMVRNGKKFQLAQHDPSDTAGWTKGGKARSDEFLETGVQVLSELQDKLYAQNHWAVLIIIQALDAAGKDGVIKHVMSGINPQGCEVHSFKAPSSEELDHDYMWRAMRVVPPRGTIGIFNRSYYEEVLVARVHPEILAAQHLPPKLVGPRIWSERCKDMRRIERYWTRNGVVIRKIFLHVSREEQKRRFLERLDKPEKNWKFSERDVDERAHWSDYMSAYDEMIRQTAAPYAPWFVVPADNKWFTRMTVASIVADALTGLDLHYPKADPQRLAALANARQRLMDER